MEDYTLIHNEEKHQYEFHIGNFTPRIEYSQNNSGEVYLTHTEVPRALTGKGIGTQLVRKVLEDIKEKELRLVPLCPFVATYIHRHPEWKKIVLRGFNV